MNETGLQPGDKVIELAAVLRSTSLFSGIVAGAINGWLSKHNVLISVITALGGGVIGYILGMLIGHIIYPATSGNVVIVKVGISSLANTLKGGVPSAIIVSVLVTVLGNLIMKNQIMTGIWPSLATGILIGIGIPCLSSLL